ncbi:MAG: hypothetical protein IJ257_01240 [Treponema sp.]|nr:hypothetical protein [Treponema sp.]
MGFDEANLSHGFLCVTIDEKKSLSVEKILSPHTFIYRRISGSLSEIKNELENLEKLGSEKKTFLELHYKREIGVNAQEYLEEKIRSLPENICVVSWKIAEGENAFFSSGFENFDASEIKNLDDKAVFSQLILSKSGLDGESEEGKAVLEKYLPLFMKIAGEV